MSKNYFGSNKFKTVTKLAVFCLSMAIAITACGSQSLGDDNGSEAGDSFSQESNELQNGDRQPPNLDEAAEKLGVSEDELVEALGNSPPPDLEAAAEKLGVSVEELKDALPPPPERSIFSGSRDNMVKLWDVKQQSLVHTFEGHQGWVNSVVIPFILSNKRLVQ